MLPQMSARLVARPNFEAAIETLLDDVIALHGAEYGNVQLPVGEEVAIAAQRGHSADFLQVFRRIKKNDGSACGRALRLGRQIIVHDVEVDPDFAPFRYVAKSSGFRSVQSTPLIAQGGTLLGVVSTHFAHIRGPTLIEMQILREYSAFAAEHLFTLLGDVPLGTKAAQMNEALYASLQDLAPGRALAF